MEASSAPGDYLARPGRMRLAQKESAPQGTAFTLTVGGVDLTAYLQAHTPQVVSNGWGQPGTMHFRLQGATGAPLSAVDVEQEVVWSVGSLKLFGGVLRTITPSAPSMTRENYVFLDCECQDYISLMEDNVVDTSGSNAGNRTTVESDLARIQWLFATWGTKGITTAAPYVQVTTASMPPQDFRGMNLREAVLAVLAVSGAEYYVDYNKALHTFVTETIEAPFNLSSAPNNDTTFGYDGLTYPEDSAALKNAVFMIPAGAPLGGATSTGNAVPTWYTDSVSIAAYGRREAAQKQDQITAQADLDNLGAAFLLANSRPHRAGSLTCYQPGLLAGMTVKITSVMYNLWAQPFRITRVTTTYPSDTGPAFLVEFADQPYSLSTQIRQIIEYSPGVPQYFKPTLQTYFQVVRQDLPLHYFRLAASGGLHDYGSYGIDATLVGTVDQYQDGLIGNPDFAAKFVSSVISGVHVDEGAAATPPGPLNLAIEAWVKPNAVGPNWAGFGNASAVVSWAHESNVPGSPSGNFQVLAIKNGTDVYWQFQSQPFGAGLDEGDAYTNSGLLTIGQKYHIVTKYTCGPSFAGDGNGIASGGHMYLYINGVLVASHAVGSFRPFILTPSGTSDVFMQIGYQIDWTAPGRYSEITLDEVAIYGNSTLGGDPLPDDRILAHYLAGKAYIV